MSHITDLNKESWELFADKYSVRVHSKKVMDNLISNPTSAFHAAVWHELEATFSDFHGLRVCVPSSGDNHAVFAFALLGASVVSCDISENQLKNAKRVADMYGIGKSIEFVTADTMRLCGVPDNEFDFVYTSNGVHVWINDLRAMYKNIVRILKSGGTYVMYDIHPFQRPFDDNFRIYKPYDSTGPFYDDNEVNFHWRIMDIQNAMINCGLSISHIDEMFSERDPEFPYWFTFEDYVSGKTATPEEMDEMYDWQKHPEVALPNWLCIKAHKR